MKCFSLIRIVEINNFINTLLFLITFSGSKIITFYVARMKARHYRIERPQYTTAAQPLNCTMS